LSGSDASIEALTERLGMGKGHVTSLVRLSYLGPDIVRALLKGRQPGGRHLIMAAGIISSRRAQSSHSRGRHRSESAPAPQLLGWGAGDRANEASVTSNGFASSSLR
jgi:hypothetical protein